MRDAMRTIKNETKIALVAAMQAPIVPICCAKTMTAVMEPGPAITGVARGTITGSCAGRPSSEGLGKTMVMAMMMSKKPPAIPIVCFETPSR